MYSYDDNETKFVNYTTLYHKTGVCLLFQNLTKYEHGEGTYYLKQYKRPEGEEEFKPDYDNIDK